MPKYSGIRILQECRSMHGFKKEKPFNPRRRAKHFLASSRLIVGDITKTLVASRFEAVQDLLLFTVNHVRRGFKPSGITFLTELDLNAPVFRASKFPQPVRWLRFARPDSERCQIILDKLMLALLGIGYQNHE